MSGPILFVVPSLKTGGGARVMIELANLLVKERPVSILYPKSTGTNTFRLDDAVSLEGAGFRANSSPLKVLNLCWCMPKARLRQKRYENVVISGPILSPLTAALSGHGRVFSFLQADDYTIFDDRRLIRNRSLLSAYKGMTRWSYGRRNVRFIFNSRFTYDRFVAVSRRTDVPYRPVSPAVDLSVFNSASSRRREGGPVSLCFVARRSPLKGLQTFIDAVRSVDAQAPDRLAVTLISHDSLDEYDFPCHWRLLRPSNDEEIASAYRESDIFVSSSWSEGFGLPALEAMACGCAVITSDNGGCREYARPDENCLMFEPKNAPRLAECLMRLARDAKLRDKLGKAGIDTATQFAWECAAEQMKQILDGKW